MKSADPLLTPSSALLAFAIADIDTEIAELEKQKSDLMQIDFSRPLTEEEWHTVCSSSLRSTPFLGLLLKQIFPKAENIEEECNCVSMNLYGFRVEVPTTFECGVAVSTEWYSFLKTIQGEEEYFKYRASEKDRTLSEYFHLLDSGARWKQLAKIRCGGGGNLTLAFLWFGWYRWHPWKRADYEQMQAEWHEKWDKYRQAAEQKNAEVHAKARTLADTLLPELRRWTDTVRGTGWIAFNRIDPETILRKEKAWQEERY